MLNLSWDCILWLSVHFVHSSIEYKLHKCSIYWRFVLLDCIKLYSFNVMSTACFKKVSAKFLSFIYAFQMHFSYHFQASIVFPDSWNLLELCNHSLWTSSLQYFFIIVAWCKLIWGVHAALPHSDDITLKENNEHLMLTVSSSGWCLRLFRVSCIYSSLISHHHRYMYTKPHYHHNYLKKTIYKNIIILCWYKNFKRNINEHAYISVLL